MSLFFIDNSSELSKNELKNLGIEIFNLPYLFNNDVKCVDDDFDYDKFYSKFNKGICINWQDKSKEEYISIFEPCLRQNDDIVYVCGSQNILNNKNAFLVRDELLEKYPERKFEIIDSSNFSIGQGVVSYELALLYRLGHSIDEIVEKSYEIKNQVATYFIIDDTEQLYLNSLLPENSVSGTALNVKPIVTINFDGKIELVEKLIGKKRAFNKLISYIRELGENVADYPIGIVYTDNLDEANDLKNKIIELFGKDVNIFFSRLSPNNTAIIGKSVLGLSFRVHKKML